MAKTEGGSGQVATQKELVAFEKMRGLDLPAIIDLNQTPPAVLAARPLLGKAVALKIVRLRKRRLSELPPIYYTLG